MVAPLWQLSVSSQHMVKSLTRNPYMSLCNLKLCTHSWSTKFVPLPRKCGPKFTKIFRGCYSTKPLTNPNFVKISLKCLRYPQSKICAPRKSRPKFANNFLRMLLTKTPNYAKIYGHRLKNARDIRDRRFVPPKMSAKVHQNFLGDATPQNA